MAPPSNLVTLSVALLLVPFTLAAYTEIPPVKLLTVTSVANRFPAAGSINEGGSRTNIENGFVSLYCHFSR